MSDELPVAARSPSSPTGRPPSRLRVSPARPDAGGRATADASTSPGRNDVGSWRCSPAGPAGSSRSRQSIDAMWGDDPPPTAAKTLQSHVVRLRQSLAAAGDPIETAPGGYRLAIEPEAIDVGQFERLAAEGAAELRLGHASAAASCSRRRSSLWHGPALMEFADDEFAVGERTASRSGGSSRRGTRRGASRHRRRRSRDRRHGARRRRYRRVASVHGRC